MRYWDKSKEKLSLLEEIPKVLEEMPVEVESVWEGNLRAVLREEVHHQYPWVIVLEKLQ